MITGNKIPFINENKKMKTALDLMSSNKLGILVVRNNKNLIKSYSFGKAFILHQSCRYALLCKLAGIKNILGYGRNFQFLF